MESPDKMKALLERKTAVSAEATSPLVSASHTRWQHLAEDGAAEKEDVVAHESKEEKSAASFFFDKYPKLAALEIINPSHKDGDCFEAHQQVYDFLVLGKPPTTIEDLERKLRSENIEGKDYIAHEVEERWEAMHDILEAGENGSVFAVDTDDHAFNLLKIEDKLYVIDSSFGIYKEIKAPEDFIYTEQDLPVNFPLEEREYVVGLNLLDERLECNIAFVGSIRPELVSAHKPAAAQDIDQEEYDDSEDNILSCK